MKIIAQKLKNNKLENYVQYFADGFSLKIIFSSLIYEQKKTGKTTCD